MKKHLISALALLLLLPSCGREKEAQYHVNNAFGYGCVLGDTYYPDFGIGESYYTPGGMIDGLCRDPLCSHDYTKDGICPDSSAFFTKSMATDGERLYFSAINWTLTENGAMFRQIYSLNPDGSDLRLLCTYEITGNTSPDLKIELFEGD